MCHGGVLPGLFAAPFRQGEGVCVSVTSGRISNFPGLLLRYHYCST